MALREPAPLPAVNEANVDQQIMSLFRIQVNGAAQAGDWEPATVIKAAPAGAIEPEPACPAGEEGAAGNFFDYWPVVRKYKGKRC